MDGLSWFALGIIFFVILALVYGIVAIHDIPYNIAKKRNHPHADAIHTGGWISLFTLHAIWPLLWVWATSYQPGHGYAGKRPPDAAPPPDPDSLEALKARVAALESAQSTPPPAA
jgi:hypothetical protein